jgi:hypothetical protein
MNTIFEYMYRDAGNYKSRGKIVLIGEMSDQQLHMLRESLETDELFVAEQVGIPTLHDGLWRYGGGPTEDDHAYHEFVGVRVVPESDVCGIEPWGNVSDLLVQFQRARGNWNCRLSSCCYS